MKENALTTTNPLRKAIIENADEVIDFLLSCHGFAPTYDDLKCAVSTHYQMNIVERIFPLVEMTDEEKSALLFDVVGYCVGYYLLQQGCRVDIKNADGFYPHEVVANNSLKELFKEKFTEVMFEKERNKQLLAVATPVDQDNFAERFSTLKLSVGDFKVCNDAKKNEFSLEFMGQNYTPSGRFLNSLARKLKFSNNIFNYFSGEEVFERIAERNPDVMFQVTFDKSTNTVLGVVDEDKPILPADIACKILQNDSRITEIKYEDGVVKAFFDINEEFAVDKDSEYRRLIYLTFPVDGVSVPSIYLAVERQVCSNGMTALVNQFKTDIEINDNSGLHLGKVLQTFNNPAGFFALESRINKAQITVASVHELLQIQKLLQSQVQSKLYYGRLISRLEELAGDPCSMYETTSLHNIQSKRRSLLPVGCSVNDLINFCTELTTHHSNVLSNPQYIHNALGRMLSQEFDLEDLYNRDRQARDFVLHDVKLDRNDVLGNVG